ncbi:hypothetical protein [Winogradskyella sp. A3E31]|uniref:hypothetical protein n=1 Tax=Winogradskyella sp. A3E31 TaxID=3349637 RepID=UPI00398AFEC9
MFYSNRLIILLFILISCHTGKLTLLGSINSGLKEVSAAELVNGSNLAWVIEDNGNANNLYGLTYEGKIEKSIDIINSENDDWEDLTSDEKGNIYIGDFGNNSESRQHFTIYKVSKNDLKKQDVKADKIEFTLPKKKNSRDFEAFFLLNNHFYIFSKEHKETTVYKIPNIEGKHRAEFVLKHDFKSKHIRITSADIATDGTIVLLNHKKMWLLKDYPEDQFFDGKIEEIDFNHNSQKEGICFFPKEKNVLISDERKGADGGNFYLLKIKD